MFPILTARCGDKVTVSRVGGSEAVRQRLGELGFVVGGNVEVVQSQGGDMIVKVLESKLAITREMAAKIMVDPT